MLAYRFGARAVFRVLRLLVAGPVALVHSAKSYQNLLIAAFLLGRAGSSFAVGVGDVSRWYSMENQCSALGVHGLGNIGQSAPPSAPSPLLAEVIIQSAHGIAAPVSGHTPRHRSEP